MQQADLWLLGRFWRNCAAAVERSLKALNTQKIEKGRMGKKSYYYYYYNYLFNLVFSKCPNPEGGSNATF